MKNKKEKIIFSIIISSLVFFLGYNFSPAKSAPAITPEEADRLMLQDDRMLKNSTLEGRTGTTTVNVPPRGENTGTPTGEESNGSDEEIQRALLPVPEVTQLRQYTAPDAEDAGNEEDPIKLNSGDGTKDPIKLNSGDGTKDPIKLNSGDGTRNPSEGLEGGSGIYWPKVGLAENTIQGVLSNVLRWLLGIFGMLALIGFIISGIQYLMAAGSESMLETAKRNMTWSIVGVVVALSGFIIVQAIDMFLRGSFRMF